MDLHFDFGFQDFLEFGEQRGVSSQKRAHIVAFGLSVRVLPRGLGGVGHPLRSRASCATAFEVTRLLLESALVVDGLVQLAQLDDGPVAEVGPVTQNFNFQ